MAFLSRISIFSIILFLSRTNKEMNMINSTFQAKIDKTKITGFDLLDLDTEIANPNSYVINADSSKNIILTPSGNYHSVRIRRNDFSDAPFDLFDIRKGINPSSPIKTLEITQNDPLTRNLYGFTFEELNHRLYEVDDYLISSGILCDWESARFKYLEINKTFPIDYEFNDYQRIMSMFVTSLKASLKFSRITFDIKRDGTVYYCGAENSSMRMKIYDKSNELAELGVKAPHNLLRFELVFKDEESIKRYFGTSMVKEFTDELIQNVFSSFIQENIIETFFDVKKSRLNEALEIYEKCFKTYSSHLWTRQAVSELQNLEIKRNSPILLDITEIIETLTPFFQSHGYEGKGRVLSKKRQNCRDSFKRVVREQFPMFETSDLKKANELFNKLS